MFARGQAADLQRLCFHASHCCLSFSGSHIKDRQQSGNGGKADQQDEPPTQGQEQLEKASHDRLSVTFGQSAPLSHFVRDECPAIVRSRSGPEGKCAGYSG